MDVDGTAAPFRRLDESLIHRSHAWEVTRSTFEGPGGERFERDVVRTRGAVSVVPILDRPDGPYVVLVRQFRHSVLAETIEIPAGMRDVAGEDPLGTARRELAEEAGFAAKHYELLTMFHPSAGLTDATHHLFLATGLTPVPRDLQGPEEALMTVLEVPFAEAVEMVESGRLTAANTVIGLLLAERRLGLRPAR